MGAGSVTSSGRARMLRISWPALAKAVVAGCARRGVVMLSCGTYGNVIRMLPPLVIEASLVEDAMDVLGEALAEALG